MRGLQVLPAAVGEGAEPLRWDCVRQGGPFLLTSPLLHTVHSTCTLLALLGRKTGWGPGWPSERGLHTIVFPLEACKLPSCLAAARSAATAEGRLREAEGQGASAEACVLVKHLRQALQSSQLTAPAQLLCGIAGGWAGPFFVRG